MRRRTRRNPFVLWDDFDYDDRMDNTRIPTDGSVTLAKLDPTISTQVGNLLSTLFATATNGLVTNADVATDATQKKTAFGTRHYTNSEEPVLGLRVVSSDTSSQVQIGGGSTLGNAATRVEVYTGATPTTLAGTLAAFWNAAGEFDQLGDLRLGADTGGQRFAYINSAAAQYRNLSFLTAGVSRWNLRATNDAESGADAGTNLQIQSRTDAGASKTVVVDINRATGLVTLGGALSTLASAAGGAGLRVPHGTAPSAPNDGDLWTTTAGQFSRINGATRQAALLDTNNNLSADTFIPGETSTPTAAGTTTLDINSTQTQVFTGTTTQTVKLPTTGVIAGQSYTIANQSTGAVTVQSSGGNTITTLNANKLGEFVALVDTPTTAAHWMPFAPTPSAVALTGMMRDSNANVFANAFVANVGSTVTSAGTLTMSIASAGTQIFTGSTTHTVKLPTTSIQPGQMYVICNQSSGTVTIQSSDGSTITTAAAGALVVLFAQQATPTAAAHWRAI